MSLYKASNSHVYANLISTKSATGCSGHPIYASRFPAATAMDSVINNIAYGYNGNNRFCTIAVRSLGVPTINSVYLRILQSPLSQVRQAVGAPPTYPNAWRL